MDPFVVHATDTDVEVWSGYRIQFSGMEQHPWQIELKGAVKQALSRLAVPIGAQFSGYYDSTDPRSADVENSLFTNLLESMPTGVTSLRFERGTADPPAPPTPITLIDGHLHYYRYRYQTQAPWARWEPNQTLARWKSLPRRLSDDGSARPVWFALRDGNANGLVRLLGTRLDPGAHFGVRLTVHATNRGPRNAILYSERLVDGTIAAFHDDRYSDALLAALTPKFRTVKDKPSFPRTSAASHSTLAPLSDDEAQAQLTQLGKEIVSAAQLQNVDAGFAFSSCNDQGDPPHQGSLEIGFTIPSGQNPDAYLNAVAAHMKSLGWVDGPPPGKSYVGKVLSMGASPPNCAHQRSTIPKP